MRRKLPLLFFIVFLAGLCAAVVLRCVLVHSFIDLSTGFYRGNYAPLALALNVVTGVCAVVLLAALVLPKRAAVSAQLPARNRQLGVLAALAAAAMVVDALGILVGLVTTNTSGGTFLDALFTMAAAIYFMVLAKTALLGDRPPHAAAALVPVFWATAHLIVTWMHFTVVTNMPNDLFQLFQLIAFMLFFYFHARFFGPMPNGREVRGLLAFGLLAPFMGLLSVLPQLFGTLGDWLNLNIPDMVLTLVLSAYMLSLFCQMFFRRGGAAD